MNIILCMSDSYRHDNLSCYGPTSVKTPRLDKFAGESVVFDNAYLGSFPTIPNRLDIMSGRFSFIDHEWCPLPKETVTLQQILSASGYITYLVCDNPHLIEMGFNYDRGYDGWEWTRGQETDTWKVLPRDPKFKCDVRKLRSGDFLYKNHLRNSAWWKGEEDTHVARSITTACKVLEDLQHVDKFFMHIDLFDPHEPWDPPQSYTDLYDPGYDGDIVNYPQYDYWRNWMSERELKHAKAMYNGEASLVDKQFGCLLDKLDELGLTEDTIVIFTSDHGFLFGEHDLVGKSLISPKGSYEAVWMYDDIRRQPLMVRIPGEKGGRHLTGIVQSPDLFPTILEMAGLVATQTMGGQSHTQALQCGVFYTEDWKFKPEHIHGKSIMPLVRGETSRIRDIAVCSNTLIHHNPILSKSAIVTEDGYVLHYAGAYENVERDAAMFINKLVDTEIARIPVEPALFDLKKDPDEKNNILSGNEALAKDILQRSVKWLENVGMPSEHLEGRRKLR
jgi:arylsulfatase A-like enzyme